MVQRVIALVVIVAIVIGGGYYAYKALFPEPEEAMTGPVYATQPVRRGDISVSVDVQGQLWPSQSGAIHLPWRPDDSIQYVFDKYHVEEGDAVKAGDVVVTLLAPTLQQQLQQQQQKLEQSRKQLADLLGTTPDNLGFVDPSQGVILRAPIGGRVTGLTAKNGTQVRNGETVARIVDDGKFRIVATVLTGEIDSIKVGAKAFVRLPEFAGLTNATVVDVNPNRAPVPQNQLCGGDQSSTAPVFVHWVTIEGTNHGLITPGMQGTVGIGTSPQADGMTDTMWLRYCQTIEGYGEESPIVSPVDASVTRVYVQDMAIVKAGDPIIAMAGGDIRSKIAELQNQVHQDEQELIKLQQSVGQLEVKAPVDGVVVNLQQMSPGQSVQAGTWFGEVFNPGMMQMHTQVTDIEVVRVQQGAQVMITVDAVPGEVFEGTVRQVSMSGGRPDQGTNLYQVWIELVGGPSLRPGMQANGHIDAGSATDALLVPIEAVFQDRGLPAVEVLNEDGTTTTVPIEVGLMSAREVEVLSGLEEGQLVITGSSIDLLPSQHIRGGGGLLPGGGQ